MLLWELVLIRVKLKYLEYHPDGQCEPCFEVVFVQLLTKKLCEINSLKRRTESVRLNIKFA